MPRPLRIGARSSALSLAQASLVQAAFATHHPHIRTELVPIAAPAEREPCPDTGLKPGAVTSDIEHALLGGECDVAMRCMKDVPGVPLTPMGTVFAAYLPRGDRRDALVNRSGLTLDRLPAGTQIATSSTRRAAFLARSHPRLTVVPIRGTVDARLAALEAGAVGALILALSGLESLGQWHLVAEVLGVERMCPPLGAAALGLQCRADDTQTISLLAPLDDARTRREITAERVLLRVMQGRCEAPVAGHCTVRPDGWLSLRGTAFTADGRRFLHSHRSDGDPAALGARVAQELLNSGARDLIPSHAP
ncbi:hydroxymethylbilane synthase [Streptomyces triculaminicus]|uniref:hydroxymethylbilane synthase n=1 Tax=Streptomyces triculaminicus TaxID=2816232 RepID=UPI0037CD77CB